MVLLRKGSNSTIIMQLFSVLLGLGTLGGILAGPGCVEELGAVLGNATLTDITVIGPSTVSPGASVAFGVVANFDDGSSMNMIDGVTWSVTQGVGTVGSLGQYTAPASVEANTAVTVKAVFTWNGVTKEGTKTFTVIGKNTTSQKTLTGLIVDGADSLEQGEAAKFTATATFSDTTTQDVSEQATWSVDSDASNPGTMSSGGSYSAPVTVEVDMTVTVKAVYVFNGVTEEATKSFTVSADAAPPQKTVTGLTIGGVDTLGQGEAANFTATATFSDNTTQDVSGQATWSVSGDAPDLGTVDAGGKYTAPATIDTQTTVTLTAKYDSVQATKIIGLNPPAAPPVTGVEVKISGQVFDANGAAVTGVTVNCSYNSLSRVTDGSGYYSFRVPSGWSGTVTPQSSQYVLTPASYTYQNVTADKPDQNFTAGSGVPGTNHPPVANSQTLSTTGSALAITLSGSDADGDTLSFTVVTQPAHGVLTGTAPAITYTPQSGYTGSDSFTFKVSDASTSSSPATITIQVGSEAPPASQNVIYVDSQISSASSTTYNPATRSASGGAARAYKTFVGAAGAAQPGDTVLIRGGTYSEKLVPANSGTAGNYITYKNYNGETVNITGSSLCPAIDISDRSYVIIDGLTVDTVQRWMYALNVHYTIVQNNHFLHANDSGNSSKTGLFYQEATYNKILNNTIEDSTEDNLSLIKSDRNLVEGNTFNKAVHTLWCIKGGNYNVIRNNYFTNPDQKIGECYDMDQVGFDHQFSGVKCTRYNLIEGNTFALTKYSSKTCDYNAIQYGAQNGIIRKNEFYNNAGGGLTFQIYSPESLYNLSNRVYNNVFYNNNHGGTYLGGGAAVNLSDNLFKNNILYKNYDESGRLSQILLVSRQGFLFENNDIFYQQAGQNVIDYSSQVQTLSWYESNYAGLFKSNLEVNPKFVNETGHDFHLQAGSPMIDKGEFLTRTSSSGSGTTISVADAGWFYDGFGIPGEVGDEIQLEGQAQTARIVSVDFANNKITVDRTLSWTSGQGISPGYSGSGPDIGAYEYNP